MACIPRVVGSKSAFRNSYRSARVKNLVRISRATVNRSRDLIEAPRSTSSGESKHGFRAPSLVNRNLLQESHFVF